MLLKIPYSYVQEWAIPVMQMLQVFKLILSVNAWFLSWPMPSLLYPPLPPPLSFTWLNKNYLTMLYLVGDFIYCISEMCLILSVKLNLEIWLSPFLMTPVNFVLQRIKLMYWMNWTSVVMELCDRFQKKNKLFKLATQEQQTFCNLILGLLIQRKLRCKYLVTRILEDASHFTVGPGGYFLLLVEEDTFTSGSYCIGTVFDGIITIYSLHLHVHN